MTKATQFPIKVDGRTIRTPGELALATMSAVSADLVGPGSSKLHRALEDRGLDVVDLVDGIGRMFDLEDERVKAEDDRRLDEWLMANVEDDGVTARDARDAVFPSRAPMAVAEHAERLGYTLTRLKVGRVIRVYIGI